MEKGNGENKEEIQRTNGEMGMKGGKKKFEEKGWTSGKKNRGILERIISGKKDRKKQEERQKQRGGKQNDRDREDVKQKRKGGEKEKYSDKGSGGERKGSRSEAVK